MCALAFIETAWFTAQPPGFASFGVLSETVGATLSTRSVSDTLLVTLAAFVALS